MSYCKHRPAMRYIAACQRGDIKQSIQSLVVISKRPMWCVNILKWALNMKHSGEKTCNNQFCVRSYFEMSQHWGNDIKRAHFSTHVTQFLKIKASLRLRLQGMPMLQSQHALQAHWDWTAGKFHASTQKKNSHSTFTLEWQCFRVQVQVHVSMSVKVKVPEVWVVVWPFGCSTTSLEKLFPKFNLLLDPLKLDENVLIFSCQMFHYSQTCCLTLPLNDIM